RRRSVQEWALGVVTPRCLANSHYCVANRMDPGVLCVLSGERISFQGQAKQPLSFLFPIQPINQASLGRAERDPAAQRALQADEEFFEQSFRLARQLTIATELDLKRVLGNKRHVLAARTPERDIGVRHDTLAEIQLSNGQQEFFDDPFVDEL